MEDLEAAFKALNHRLPNMTYRAREETWFEGRDLYLKQRVQSCIGIVQAMRVKLDGAPIGEALTEVKRFRGSCEAHTWYHQIHGT